MKTFTNSHLFIAKISDAVFAGALALTLSFSLSAMRADETCSSPYLARIEGQEEYVYGWTLGAAGPHGAYALPGRVLIPCLSNAKDHGGRTALVEYGNDGNYITTHWLPAKDDTRGAANANVADGYGYDARVLPRKNALLTSSFTGWNNYTMDFGKLTADPEAMKHFGSTMVMWDFHARQPKKIFEVPGVPLEIRWAWGDNHNYAFTATALTSKLWLVYEDEKGAWQAKEVAPIGDVKGGVLPVDISLSADDETLFVSCYGDGKCRVFDVSDPLKPKQIY